MPDPDSGSMLWKNVRGRARTALKKLGMDLDDIDLHHWFFQNNGRVAKIAEKIGARRAFDWFAQRNWNLNPMLREIHKRMHSADNQLGKDMFNFAQRWWYGTPVWAKAAQGSIAGGAIAKMFSGASCECEN